MLRQALRVRVVLFPEKLRTPLLEKMMSPLPGPEVPVVRTTEVPLLRRSVIAV